MPTFLLPEKPVTSFDAWFATDVGDLGVNRAQELGPAARIGLRANPYQLVEGVRPDWTFDPDDVARRDERNNDAIADRQASAFACRSARALAMNRSHSSSVHVRGQGACGT